MEVMRRICWAVWLVMGALTAADLPAPVVDARKALQEAATDKEAGRRIDAASALSLIARREPSAKLLDSLVADPDYLVRQAAITSLGELADPARMGTLREALQDPVPEVAFAAAKTLYALNDPQGIAALQEIYTGDRETKSSFFKREFRDNMRRLKTPKSAFFFAVEKGIGFAPVPGLGTGYTALTSVLNDTEASARATSVILLCQDARQKRCTDLLIAAVQDEDWTVRAAAVHVMARTNQAKWKLAIEPLILGDKKSKVRLIAAAAYLRLETVSPAPPKVKTLKHASIGTPAKVPAPK